MDVPSIPFRSSRQVAEIARLHHHSPWTAIAIGIIGVLVGAIALVYSARASTIAKDTLDLMLW